jgi:hypothetical protein
MKEIILPGGIRIVISLEFEDILINTAYLITA